MRRRADVDRLRRLMRQVAACRACQLHGFLTEVRPVTAEAREARVLVIGQAPGPVTHREGIHFAGPAGRTLAGWFEAAGFPSGAAHKWPTLSAVWLTSLTRCFPGPSASGNGDRAPTSREVALCRPFLEEEIRVVDPDVIVLVGAMAVRAFLGPIKLEDAVGRRFEQDGRAVIAFPHSSGVSRWTNLPENRTKVERSIALLRAERERLVDTDAPSVNILSRGWQHDS
ncbi:MAG: uracil-DNA glycosylase [Chloroflexi bacterium]|nr:uracil-DNA glycosylase [Chloroflexota bacterium]